MRWWVEWAVAALALVGLWVAVDKAAAGVLRAWTWLRYDRVAPLLEDEPGCTCCEDGGRCYGVDPDECGQCGHPESWHVSGLGELPPERSWEEMTSHRRAPLWEAEHRAAYESLGFDYPSGLVARVRELTP